MRENLLKIGLFIGSLLKSSGETVGLPACDTPFSEDAQASFLIDDAALLGG